MPSEGDEQTPSATAAAHSPPSVASEANRALSGSPDSSARPDPRGAPRVSERHDASRRQRGMSEPSHPRARWEHAEGAQPPPRRVTTQLGPTGRHSHEPSRHHTPPPAEGEKDPLPPDCLRERLKLIKKAPRKASLSASGNCFYSQDARHGVVRVLLERTHKCREGNY